MEVAAAHLDGVGSHEGGAVPVAAAQAVAFQVRREVAARAGPELARTPLRLGQDRIDQESGR